MKKDIIQTLKVLLAAIVLSLGISYVYAWTAPTTTPPAGNTPAPLNEGTTTQTKNGGLGVNAFTANSASFSGNVGIGTTTPSEKLDVNGNIQLGDGSSGDLRFNSLPGYSARFFVDGAQRMTIDSASGNVGIGVTNPTNKLQVTGDIVGSRVIQAGTYLRAPKFVDTNNSSYYVDPASASIFNTTYINKVIFPDGSIQSTAATVGNPAMIASGRKCIPQAAGSTLWYPPAGWYNFTGTHSVVRLELNTSSGWGGGDNAGANAGTMWFDGANMRIELLGQCVYWQRFNHS